MRKHKKILISLGVLLLCSLETAKVKAEEIYKINEEEKSIYLTFDDGPSFIVTNKILDILKEKGVKATFFVVGSKIQGREDILKRIDTEGHSIGLHTFTHVYKKIYSSHDNFINEMDETQKEVNRVLGYSPKAIRFPTGSKPHLNSVLLEKLHNKNYKIYDWNACLSDGINYNTPTDRLVREAHNIVGKGNSRIFLLLHCDQTNKNTAKALPFIIDYYKDLGYQFKTITEDTSEYYFRFKK
ncbi:polysaccharide deacetylase family protein [Candidatus Clostridium radicumherbarum]|uniref:Polysaccharide deacetylase family protein n=1 Tax=Candidatus Clostridium radicumherbarum TaxID=3381662 RepID=A0ABW8TN61_9CLOT